MTRDEQRVYSREKMREYRASHPEFVERERAYSREWRRQHPERVRELNAKHLRPWHLKKLYGLTVEQYDALLAKQDGDCAVCGKSPSKRRLAVDHSHSTGMVRGLLCDRCNTIVAYLEHKNPELVSKARTYLTKHEVN